MRYELTDLRVVVAIAESRNLTVASSDLCLSAPSVSYRVKHLEEAMGVSLFVRTQKGMEITQAGEVVLKHAKAILAEAARLNGELVGFNSGVKGTVRVFANSSTLHRLTPTLGRFLSAYPSVDVDLSERLSDEIVAAVAEGAADLGLVAGPVDLRRLEAVHYADDELVFAVAVHHPLAARLQVSLEDALAFDFIATGRKTSNFLYLSMMASRLGVQPRVRVHAPNFAAALQLVEQDVGILLIPRSVAAEVQEEATIAIVKLGEPWALRQHLIVCQKFSELPKYAQAFADHVVQK